MKLLLPSTALANWNFNFCVKCTACVNALLDRNIVSTQSTSPQGQANSGLYTHFVPSRSNKIDYVTPAREFLFFSPCSYFFIKTSFLLSQLLRPLNGDCPLLEVFKKKKVCLHHLIVFSVKGWKSLSHAWLFATPWATHDWHAEAQKSGHITLSWGQEHFLGRGLEGGEGAGFTWGGGIALRGHLHVSSRPTGWGRGPREARGWQGWRRTQGLEHQGLGLHPGTVSTVEWC